MNNDEEREIDLKLLFAYVFKQWRKILLTAVVFCMLGAGYKCMKVLPTYSTLQSQYDQSLQSYENSKASSLEQQGKTQSSIDYLVNYSKNSVKANIDPYNEAKTQFNVSVVTSTGQDDFEALLSGTNHANQITQAYITYCNALITDPATSSALGIDGQYLSELVTVSGSFDVDIVSITVIGNSEEQTKTIANYLASQVSKNTDAIKSKYGDHTAVFGDTVTSTITDTALATPVSDQMKSPNAVMNDTLAKIAVFQTTLGAQQTAMAALKAPALVSTTLAKGIVKDGLLGLVGGLIGMIILLAIIKMMSDKILSEDDLSSMNIKTLGVLPMKASNKNKFDHFMLKKIDSSYGVSEEISLAKASANISVCTENKKSLILVSCGKITHDTAELQTSLQALNLEMKYLVSSDVNSSAEELKKLGTADGIILVAQRDATKMDEVKRIKDTAATWQKPIVGSIVL
jgi:capsular polysaccharide biosynthesis protein